MNAELNNAVCHQNWGKAIAIIDRIGAISPQSGSQLEEYRDRLVTLQNTGARMPGWREDCVPPTTTDRPDN